MLRKLKTMPSINQMKETETSRKEAAVPVPEKSIQKKVDKPITVNKLQLGKQYKVFSAKLELDLDELVQLRNEDRDERKRELIKNYKTYVDMFLHSDDKARNRIYSWFVVWLLDVGQIDQFIKYALWGIQRNQNTPEGYKTAFGQKKKAFARNLPEFLFDGIMKWSFDQMKNDRTPRPYFDQVYENMNSNDYCTHKIIKVKMHIMQAKICFKYEFEKKAVNNTERSAHLIKALHATRSAKVVDNEAKCKTLHDKIIREMVKLEMGKLWEVKESYPAN